MKSSSSFRVTLKGVPLRRRGVKDWEKGSKLAEVAIDMIRRLLGLLKPVEDAADEANECFPRSM